MAKQLQNFEECPVSKMPGVLKQSHQIFSHNG
jgi:hypothetical protein